MAQPLIAPLPPDIDLSAGCVIRIRGVNPSTGATVGGIVLNNVTIQVRQTQGAFGDLAVGPFMVVPGPGA